MYDFGAKNFGLAPVLNGTNYPSCKVGLVLSFTHSSPKKGSHFVSQRRNMDTLSNIKNILVKFYDEYTQTTPKKLKIVDAYLFYIMLTGIIQFVYCCLVGTFPFNSFLSGFISCVGSFVLGGKNR